MSYETVIGLEVHVHLETKSKLFCGCATAFGVAPNHQTCPVCLGFPGTLPVLNRTAVEYGVRVGLALNCAIPPFSKLDRKNYFYPDLPKAYQISQYDLPLCGKGWLEVEIGETARRFGITRVHLEEDAGKLVHEGDGLLAARHSLVDYNRTGIPLLEIVSEPELKTPEEAVAYLTALRATICYLGVSACSMEEGSLRCDANVSLRPAGREQFGTKVELKNMNSFRHVRDALAYEIARQGDLLDEGGMVVQETRLWNPEARKTFPMRGKEEAHDYRYFPDPDLVPLALPPATVAAWRRALPELPAARRARVAAQYQITPADAAQLTGEKALADFFEAAVAAGSAVGPKAIANLLLGEIAAHLNKTGTALGALALTPARLAALLALQAAGKISGKMVKELLPELLTRDVEPGQLVAEKGVAQISDAGALETAIREVIEKNPGPAAEYRGGREQALGFLMGQVMKATRGQANPQLAQETLKRLLAEAQ